MRVLLRGPLNAYTGYGNEVVDLAVYLDKRGVDVTLWATSVMTGLPPEIGRLLTKEPLRGTYDVVITILPPFDLRPWEWTPAAKVAVAWTMWEWSRLLPEDMVDHGDWRKWLRKGHRWFEDIDLVMVTCPMNVDAFHALDPDADVVCQPTGVDVNIWTPAERDWYAQPMRFGMLGQMSPRKAPFDAIQAWADLKEEHGEAFQAELFIRDNGMSLHPRITELHPTIHVTNEEISRRELLDWYRSIHVMLAPSRGEGMNKPPMEHMATGGTCIASAWAGHSNWLMSDANWAIPGQLMRRAPEVPAEDFRVDRESFKQLIWHAYTHREECAEKGRQAARWMRTAFSWERMAEQVERHLQRLLLEKSGVTSIPVGSSSGSPAGT